MRKDQMKHLGVKRVLFEFNVMFCGWECDDKAWVVELEDGTRALVHTNHMRPYIAKPEEFDPFIAEYEKAIADTRKALEMVGQAA